ncbi:nucleotide sugar dehydrogenase [bacterium]|nr:nucleotide sugar dehydrogenase [bacterium]
MNICIVGLGYVGLPLAVEFAKRGHTVFGIDISESRIDKLKSAENYIGDVSSDELTKVIESGFLIPTTTFESCEQAQAVFICVPTPISDNKDPDLSAIRSAAAAIGPLIHEGQLVILKSTTFPTTTEEVVMPIVEELSGLKAGKDFHLAYSPERVDPGNTKWTTANTPIVVGGLTPACTDAAADLLSEITPNVRKVSSPKVAEMEKLLENIFRSVNIALVNEMARLCDRMGGISLWEVVDAAATKPFGFMPFYPGPGLGGHCIPIDPYYLSWLARKYDFETSFITLSARTNEDMPFYVVDAVQRVLADRGSMTPGKPRILILGAAFKKNVDDLRHSPAFKIIEVLEQQTNALVDFSDPHATEFRKEWVEGSPVMHSVGSDPEQISSYDVVVMVTDHDAFDYQEIADNARFILDTRNAFKDVDIDSERIRVLGAGQFLTHKTQRGEA